MIRLRLLGALELRDPEGNDVRSVLAQPRRTALLASLALANDGGFVRRDTLLGRLWPDAPQRRARNSLNQAIYGLRRSLGAEAVTTRGEEDVGLDRGRVSCDAVAFRAALRDGRTEEALTIYRGELLPGFFLSGVAPFEIWLEDVRAALRQEAIRGAWRLVDEAERTDDLPGAVAWGRRAVALSDHEELGVQRLLRILHRAGDRAGAVSAYEAFERRLRVDLEIEPSPETRALVEEIRGPGVEPLRPGGLPVAPPPLPRPGLPLVGRDQELLRLEERLASPHVGLMTLTGPGGVGKTRLALELVHRWTDQEPPAWFVPLAGIADSDLVPSAVARALGLSLGDAEPAEAVLRYLARRRGLLVLDNLDHLMASAPFVADLTARAPGLHVIVTSREPLRLSTEWVVPLEGLAWTDEDDPGPELLGAERLFVEAARRTAGELSLNEDKRRTVARICRQLGGMPLALELAASWCRALALEEIEGELERGRRFLAGRLRDGPERHLSLEAAFEQSWVLLDDRLRGVLARLAVLRSSFTREAAESVGGAELGDLAALVDKSLMRRLPGGRYDLLEVLRECAEDKLRDDPGAHRDATRRHALHYTRFLADLTPALAGPDKDDALARADPEMDNLRAAWRGAVAHHLEEALASAADALFTLYDGWGWHREAASALRAAADAWARPARAEAGAQGGSRSAAPVLGRLGAALLRLGEDEEGERRLSHALEAARADGDTREAAFALDRLSMVSYERGDHATAVRCLEEALELRRGLQNPRALTTSLNNLGSLHYAIGDLGNARRLLEECLDRQRASDDRAGEVISLQNLGHIALASGDAPTAERWLQLSLHTARRLRHSVLAARSLLGLATVARSCGRWQEARRYYQPALARAMQVGAESLAVEAILGTAAALAAEGARADALALVRAVLAHPDVEPEPRAGAELLRTRLEASRTEPTADVPDGGAPLTLRAAAARVTGLLPVD